MSQSSIQPHIIDLVNIGVKSAQESSHRPCLCINTGYTVDVKHGLVGSCTKESQQRVGDEARPKDAAGHAVAQDLHAVNAVLKVAHTVVLTCRHDALNTRVTSALPAGGRAGTQSPHSTLCRRRPAFLISSGVAA